MAKSATAESNRPSFRQQFTPKSITVLRDGYRMADFRADAIAGLTVAIVALPLSMAIAIASGASPAQGLHTAIVGGFLVSALGGSRFQIGGPAGAFIVLVATTVHEYGMDGLILATLLSGILLAVAGFLRLGAYIKFIPYPVTVGFTCGIAVIILVSQVKDLFGLTLTVPEPGPFLEKLPVLWAALPTFRGVTLAVAAATALTILLLRRFLPHLPGLLIAVAGVAIFTTLAGLPVATIGSKFGGIPSGLPFPSIPAMNPAKIFAVLPSAFAFALLGSIESLLSAVVADGMTGRRHRSNCEMVAQGIANIGSALVGGICVTGTIARTATNVRAGAHGPVAGMLHALMLLAFVLIAAPLASFIPLASLAGVLAVVAWNMVEKRALLTLLRASAGDAAVLLVTLTLTIFRDLTEAIVVGVALGSVIFIHRMSKATSVEAGIPFMAEDRADGADRVRVPYEQETGSEPEIVLYRISGAFFFGAAASVGAVLDRIGDQHRALIIDFSAVPFVDATAANTIELWTRKTTGRGVAVYLSGASASVRKELSSHGLKEPHVQYEATTDSALESARRSLKRE